MEDMTMVKKISFLFNCWCYKPIATFSLCLLAHNYHVAFQLVKTFPSLVVTVVFLVQMYKLVCRNIYSNQESIREKQQLGSDGGATMDSTQQFLAIVINNQYQFYLLNESNMIPTLFDTGLSCDGNMYTYVDNVLVSTSIILLCAFFCSFFVPDNESKLPAGSESANVGLLD